MGHVVGGTARPCADGLEQVLDVILTTQQDADEERVHRNMTLTHQIESRLRTVHEGHDAVEPEEPGRPFQRMHRPKNEIDGLRIGLTLGTRQEPRFQVPQYLRALSDECRQHLIDVHGRPFVFVASIRRPRTPHNLSTSWTVSLSGPSSRIRPLACNSR